ncbi:MAG TPA: hypothetical protein VLF67_01900 [Candidatus Saccharimonas sp.]|nr:hypothetical protein [Candidatus Saccharimonas sp.]
MKTAGYPQELYYGDYFFVPHASRAYILDDSSLTQLTTDFQKAPTCYELMCACLLHFGNLNIASEGADPDNVTWLVEAGEWRRRGRNLSNNLADLLLEHALAA